MSEQPKTPEVKVLAGAVPYRTSMTSLVELYQALGGMSVRSKLKHMREMPEGCAPAVYSVNEIRALEGLAPL